MITEFREDLGVVFLTDDTWDERGTIRSLKHRSRSEFLKYNGNYGAGPSDSHLEPMLLKMKVNWLDSFILRSSSVYREEHIRHIRDSMYISSGKLFFLPDVPHDKHSVPVCISFCQFCRKPIIQCTEVVEETCRWCIHRPDLQKHFRDDTLGLYKKIAGLPH